LAFITAIVMVLALATPVATVEYRATTPTDDVLRITNELRAAQSRSAVNGNHAALHAAAQVRAREAAASWSHTRPDGRAFETVLSDHHVRARAATENLARTNGYAAINAIAAWMASQDHRDNLMSHAHTHMGIGVYFCNTNNQYFWAQLFITGPTWLDNIWFAFASIGRLLFGWLM